MRDEEWIKTLGDGRRVKFIYQELPHDGAFITAQIESHEVVYSVLLANAGNPLSRGMVVSHFNQELSGRWRCSHISPISTQTFSGTVPANHVCVKGLHWRRLNVMIEAC